jgi:predicted nucleotidyltransferase
VRNTPSIGSTSTALGSGKRLDFIALEQELEELLSMEVDLGERKALRGPAGEKIQEEAESI